MRLCCRTSWFFFPVVALQKTAPLGVLPTFSVDHHGSPRSWSWTARFYRVAWSSLLLGCQRTRTSGSPPSKIVAKRRWPPDPANPLWQKLQKGSSTKPFSNQTQWILYFLHIFTRIWIKQIKHGKQKMPSSLGSGVKTRWALISGDGQILRHPKDAQKILFAASLRLRFDVHLL